MTSQKPDVEYMRQVLLESVLELEIKKNHYMINSKRNIGKLKNFVDYMRDRQYLDFSYEDQIIPKIQSQQAAKNVRNQLQKLQHSYLHLIVDRKQGDKYIPYDLLLLKLRPSPYDHVYYKCFHDLQVLNKIQPQPQSDSYKFYMREVKNAVFVEPSREDMYRSARKKWEEFKQLEKSGNLSIEDLEIKRFTEYPSESERGMTDEEMEEQLYRVDDLAIEKDNAEYEAEYQSGQVKGQAIQTVSNWGQQIVSKFREMDDEMREKLMEQQYQEEEEQQNIW